MGETIKNWQDYLQPQRWYNPKDDPFYWIEQLVNTHPTQKLKVAYDLVYEWANGTETRRNERTFAPGEVVDMMIINDSDPPGLDMPPDRFEIISVIPID